jgi:hypothetical protein
MELIGTLLTAAVILFFICVVILFDFVKGRLEDQAIETEDLRKTLEGHTVVLRKHEDLHSHQDKINQHIRVNKNG